LISTTAVAGTLLATYGPGGGTFAGSAESAPPHCLGYIEGESTLVAPPVYRLVADRSSAGAVGKGERLYAIDTTQTEMRSRGPWRRWRNSGAAREPADRQTNEERG
jgi:hypothetical protein